MVDIQHEMLFRMMRERIQTVIIVTVSRIFLHELARDTPCSEAIGKLQTGVHYDGGTLFASISSLIHL